MINRLKKKTLLPGPADTVRIVLAAVFISAVFIPLIRIFSHMDAESIKKRLSKEDKQRLDPMISSLKKAIKRGNISEIKSESDEFARVLSSIGFNFDGSQANNDDGTFDSDVN